MASTTSNITGVLSGANSSMVKLDDNSIVSLAEYQKLFDAANQGEEPQIVGILSGSEEGMVKLADNRIITVAQYVREVQESAQGEEPVITRCLSGSYGETVQTAEGITSLKELYVPAAPAS